MTQVYTHSPVARTFSGVLHCSYTSHIFMRVTHMHGSSCLRCARPCSCCTTPDYDFIDAPVHTFLPNFPELNALVKRTPHEDEQFGYLAKSVLLAPSSERQSRPEPKCDKYYGTHT